MSDKKTKSPYEVLEKVNNFKQHKRKIKYLEDNYSSSLRTILQGNFTKNINFRMPEGAPPYEPNEDAEHTEEAYKALRGIMSMGNHQWAREQALINLLQSIPPNDAELFVAMKDKKVNEIFPNITEDLVKEVWPELIQ